MTERISLSLSPTGGNVSGTLRLRADVSPELIAAHVNRARRLRAKAYGDLARGVWQALTQRSVKAPVNECDWLNPQAALSGR